MSSALPPPIPNAPRRRKAVWLLVIGIIGVPAFLLLVLVLVCTWYRLSNEAAIRKIEADIRQRGEPGNFKELADKYPPLPDAENGAALILDLWEKDDPEFWRAVRESRRPLPRQRQNPFDPDLPFLGKRAGDKPLPRWKSLPAESLAAASIFVETNRARDAALRQALRQRPKTGYPIKFTDGYDALLAHLPALRTEAKAFRVATALAIEDGADDVVIERLEDTARLVHGIKAEPLMISHFIRMAVYSMVVQDLERFVNRRQPSSTNLTRLSDLLEQMVMSGALKGSLLAERAAIVSAFENPDEVMKLDAKKQPDAADLKGWRLITQAADLAGVLAADRRFSLETMEKAVRLAEQDSPESIAQMETLFATAAEQAKKFPIKLISGFLLTPLGKLGAKFATYEARRRAAVTGLAIEQFRREQGGRLPGRLEDLAPRYLKAVPLDPFDGQPLRLRSTRLGFVVYSVGADRQDNAGRERLDPKNATDFDETFFVERFAQPASSSASRRIDEPSDHPSPRPASAQRE